jgi:hypothetical protein
MASQSDACRRMRKYLLPVTPYRHNPPYRNPSVTVGRHIDVRGSGYPQGVIPPSSIYDHRILSFAGKRKTFGGSLKFSEIDFRDCRHVSEEEYTDERGFGKYCIEFAGPGNVLLGRLQWTWRAKRFRDSERR